MGIQQVRQKEVHFHLKLSRNICESKRTLTNDIGRSLMKDGGVSVCKQLDGVGDRHQFSFQSEGWNKYPVKPSFTLHIDRKQLCFWKGKHHSKNLRAKTNKCEHYVASNIWGLLFFILPCLQFSNRMWILQSYVFAHECLTQVNIFS